MPRMRQARPAQCALLYALLDSAEEARGKEGRGMTISAGCRTSGLHHPPCATWSELSRRGEYLSPPYSAAHRSRICATWGRDKAPASKCESPAEGVELQELRNGEAEAVAKAVGRESVAQAGSARILASKPAARAASRTLPRKRDAYHGRRLARGTARNLHTPPPGAVTRKPGSI